MIMMMMMEASATSDLVYALDNARPKNWKIRFNIMV